MRHTSRLVLKGYWGTNRQPLYWNITAERLYAAAVRDGRIANLTRYREKKNDSSDRDGIGALPIGLTTRLVFPSAPNQDSAWTNDLGGTSYLDELPNAFRGNVPGLGHTSETAGRYTSTTNIILANTSHVLRLFLHKKETTDSISVAGARWGSGTDRWQLHITDNNAALMRLTAGWSQADEDELIDLLSEEEPDAADQDRIDELRTELYTDYTDLSLGKDLSNSFGTFYELQFIPEALGVIGVYCNQEFVGAVEHSEVIQTRAAGTIWTESPITVFRNGGHFFWQVGYPEVGQTTGTMRFPIDTRYYVDDLPSITYNGLWHTPTGTSVTVDDDEISSVRSDIVVTLHTENRRIWPSVYALQAYLDAGERSGSATVALDTNDHLDGQGNSPIMNVEVQHEGEFRRALFKTEIRDISGSTFTGLGFHYEVGEHRTCDLYIDDVKVLANGIVSEATWYDLKKGDPNLARIAVTKGSTEARLMLSSQWHLLEEYELQGGELVCDGMRLGAALRRCLRLIGIPFSAMSGVSSTAGRRLPTAAIGETWAVVNSAGSLADFILYLLERYAVGKVLWHNEATDVWHFASRSTDIVEIEGHPVEFLSDYEVNHPDTWPGRFAALAPMDQPRDIANFYNIYRVQGADSLTDRDGLPLVRDSLIEESVTRGAGTGSRKFIGRFKRLRTIQDSSLRTLADIEWALHSAKRMHGKPPRFHCFESYFHVGLFIGDRVTYDTKPCEVFRISGGDMQDDTMSLVLQEVD